ncbi:MAG TPA: hypothetical protein VLS85_09160, partial [Hanamia sp.]|nr:hypothetical protein [Hanamia sp.]
GQIKPIDPVKFFEDTSIVKATITTNMAKLFNNKTKTGIRFPATFTTTLENGNVIDEPILLETRGHFRKGYCYLPPLWVMFTSKTNPVMKPLGSLKLVSQCSITSSEQKYLLEEFMIYRIYNLFTNLSFRVRLLDLNIVDSAGKKKPITEYAFFLENDKALAKRNNCKNWKNYSLADVQIDRRQMTMVALFEYMIGNTDWSVWSRHNIRLLVSKIDSQQHFYSVPYDFDYSGFVNTYYATPSEGLNISSVRQRVYRGYPRTIEELEDVLNIFKNKKNDIYLLIDNFRLLNSRDKKTLTSYLDQFFDLINDREKVKYAFIQNARRD